MVAYLTMFPRYGSSNRVGRVVTDSVRALIDECLTRNRNNATLGHRKQQMRKIDIWRHLRDSVVEVAYSTVYQYVRALESVPVIEDRPGRAYIRQEYAQEMRCELDRGMLTLWIGGVRTKLHMAVSPSITAICAKPIFSLGKTRCL